MPKFDQNFTSETPPSLLAHLKEYYKDQNTIEIGPGRGFYTRELIKVCKTLTVIEIDPILSQLLSKEGYDVINKDFNKIEPTQLFLPNIRFFSSLPYSQLKNFFGAPKTLEGLFITPDYVGNKKGLFNCFFRYVYDYNILYKLPPKYFNPSPKINSIFIQVSKVRVITYSQFKRIFQKCNNKILKFSPMVNNCRLFQLSREELDNVILDNNKS